MFLNFFNKHMEISDYEFQTYLITFPTQQANLQRISFENIENYFEEIT